MPAIDHPPEPVRGSQDDLYPLLPAAVRTDRRGPARFPGVPGPADRGYARAVPARDPAGLPHEGHLHLRQDRLETPADRPPQWPELPGPTVLLDALSGRTHRGGAGPPFLRKFAVPDWALTEVLSPNSCGRLAASRRTTTRTRPRQRRANPPSSSREPSSGGPNASASQG